LALDKENRFLGLDIDLVANLGAYLSMCNGRQRNSR
jgi:hypothetical protein